MRNIYYSIVFLFVALVVTSCKKDFLDRTPSADLDEEKVFSDPALAANYADNAYNHLIDDYARFNAHRGTTAQASDEAVSGNTDVSVRTLNQGLFHDHYERGGASLNDIGDVWDRAYAGIRITNVMLSKMSTIPWGNSSQNPSRIEGEMHFIRAFLYFELIKRFGGVPIFDEAASIFDDIDIPRNTYQECLDFILADIDKAAGLLPNEYNASNYGRATKGAALALKARALLYAASPLNNPTNDVAKWKAAADAANAVRNLKIYDLEPNYKNILTTAGTQSKEYIMIKVRPPRVIDGFLLDFVMSPGSGGAQGSMNPTQNHVDMYEAVKKDGSGNIISSALISDPNSGYNPQKPYENRDPRFYANILYNDATWQGRKMGMWSQYNPTDDNYSYGADFRPNNIIYSATRYYCRKMWPEVYVRNTTQRALLNYVFFRYTEVMLNYAEALNEAEGPVAAVYSAIDSVRARGKGMENHGLTPVPKEDQVAMPPLPSGLTQAQMREAIRHERAVEMAFEDFRWYDLIRWKKAKEVLTQPVKAMDVVRNANGTFTYNVVTLPIIYQKKFDDYMYLYPIPRREVFKSDGILKQNPGW